jgi:hypothetical protein
LTVFFGKNGPRFVVTQSPASGKAARRAGRQLAPQEAYGLDVGKVYHALRFLQARHLNQHQRYTII